MTSISSSCDFLSALKYNIRRYAALLTVFQISAVFISLLHINYNYSYYIEQEKINNITEIFSDQCIPIFTVFCAFEAIILIGIMFRGIYSKRASDFYFSLPIKRGAWFNANFVFGFINFAVSYAIFYIANIVAVKSGVIKAFRFFDFQAGAFLKYVLMSFAVTIMFYAIFAMCAVVAGRIWQYILLCVVSSVILYILILGFLCYINTIYGFWFNLSEANTVSAVALAISSITDISAWKCFASAAVQFAVFYIAGYLSFKKRKAEVAENGLSGKVLPAVLTTVGFLGEVFFCLGIGNEVSLVIRIIAAVMLVAVTAVVLSAVFFRKAMSKPVLVSVIGTLVISALCVFSVQVLSEKSFVYNIPEKDEIESVTVRSYSNDGSSNVAEILYGRGYIELSDSFEKDMCFDRDKYEFSTDEAKEKTIQLHQKILSDETRNNVYSEDDYNGSVSIRIEYKLQNGEIINRFYSVSTKDVVDEYTDLLKTDEGTEQLGIIEFMPKDILFITADDVSWNENYDGSVQLDYPKSIVYDDVVFMKDIDISRLCECIIKDLKNSNPYRFVDAAGIYFDTDYQYDTETGKWYEESVYSKYDLELGLYRFNKSIDNASRARLERLSPKQMLVDNDKHGLQSDSDNEWVESFYFYFNTAEDINTVSYLKELGYKF